MLHRNSLSIPQQIAHHAHEGRSTHSLLLFLRLLRSGDPVNQYVLSALLKACGKLKTLQQGKNVHAMVLKLGFHADVALMTSLLDMYSNCALLAESRMTFLEMKRRDVIATNGMISAYCRCNRPAEAVSLFYDAPQKDVGTWNSLISGMVQMTKSCEALHFFKQMILAGEMADFVTIVTVLSACANTAASSNARQIHGIVVKRGQEANLAVGNAIVDMYTKVGNMNDACVCFKNMPVKNVITWTSLIVGYGKHGMGREALRKFEQMEMTGIVPNKVTFIGLLSTCSHSGLVREGWRCFRTMIDTYHIAPTMAHYGCVVDLLARAGELREAWQFVMSMPVKADAELWTSFLSSCLFHRNKELAKVVAERLLELKPQEAGAYVLLSNFYSQTVNLVGVVKVRRLMMSRGIMKEKAQTWVEINHTLHAFESGDRSHLNHRDIVKYLEGLVERMKSIGYVPNTDVVVQNVDEKTKEEIVLGHSEKLAIGLGLISTQPGTRIMIVKNLRVCIDCHNAIKFISKIEGREIMARDSSRFHRFRDGMCSCGNYW